MNGGGEGDAKGHGTNKQEVNVVAETLPQHDGNANGQEQTGVTDDGQLCVMEDGGAIEGEGTKAIEDQIFKVNGGGEHDAKGHGKNKQEVNVVAETLPQCDGNTNGQEQTGVTDDGQLCVMEGKIDMFSQTTGMWHELLFTDPPPVQVNQENGLFSDNSDSERGNISEQVSSVVADLVGEGGAAAENSGHDEETPKVPVKMACTENTNPDERDREKLPVQLTCKETPKVPGQMTFAKNIGPDEHNKETPNMGRDKEKLPVQQPICAENIGPDERNKETPNMGLGPDDRNEETPNMDLSKCDKGKLPVQPTCEDTAENISHDGHSGKETQPTIAKIKDKGRKVAECICHDEHDEETQPRNRDEGWEAAEAIDLNDPDDCTSVQLDQMKIVI